MADSNFIPDSDAEFDNWQENAVTRSETNATAWGIDVEAIADLKAKQALWTSAYAKAKNSQSRSTSDVHAKDEARAAYEKELRIFVGEFLAINRKISNLERENLGLTIRSTVRIPVAAPTSVPIGKIDPSLNLRHSITVTDSVSNGKAKPKGVFGCEVWIKVGTEMPTESSEFTFHGIDTRSPYTVTFEDADKGKTAYYRLRWINKRGEAGPWANVIFAMVIG